MGVVAREGVRDERTQQAAYRNTLASLSPEDANWLITLRRDESADPKRNIRTNLLPRRGAATGSLGGSDDFNGRLLALGLLVPIVGKELDTIIKAPNYRGTGLALHDFELSDYARQFLAVVGGGEFSWPTWAKADSTNEKA